MKAIERGGRMQGLKNILEDNREIRKVGGKLPETISETGGSGIDAAQ